MPEAYRELPFESTACSDIAWRRTERWRRCLARMWPGIAELRDAARRGPGRRGVAPRRLAPLPARARGRAGARATRSELAAVDVDGARVPRAARAADLERPPLGRAGRVRPRPGLRGRGAALPLLSEALNEKKGVNGVAEGAFRRHYQHVYGYLRRRVRDPHRAEELTQDVFAAAAAGLPDAEKATRRFSPGSTPSRGGASWTRRRRQRREKRVDLPEARSSSDYGPFVARALREALGALPGGQSQVVVLKLLRG